jgi:uncharacterized protein
VYKILRLQGKSRDRKVDDVGNQLLFAILHSGLDAYFCTKHMGVSDVLEYTAASSLSMTPLMIAIKKRNMRASNMLIEAGASVNRICRTEYLNTYVEMSPLSLAIVTGCGDSFLKRLLRAGANPSHVVDGFAPLLLAARTRRWSIMQTLLDWKADPTVETEISVLRTAIDFVDSSAQAEHVVIRLIELVDVNFGGSGDSPSPPIVRACVGKHPNIVKAILNIEECNVNAIDSDGYTSLMCASRDGWTEVVTLLLETRRCDLSLRNHEGKTALDLAQENNCKACVKLLSNFNRSSRKDRQTQKKNHFKGA